MKAWLLRRKESRFFVHMGDELEAITTADPRFQYDVTKEAIPLQQAEYVKKMYRSVAPQGVAWLNGNHNQKLHRFGNLTKAICEDLGIPYGTWSCKVLLTHKGEQICKMFLTHGFRGRLSSRAKDYEQRVANLKAGLKRRLKGKFSDCLIMAMGHTHKLMVVEPAKELILYDNGTDIQQDYLRVGNGKSKYISPDRRWYVNSGSFLKQYQLGTDGYAERAGYDPIKLGYAIVRIRDAKVQKIEEKTL